VTGQWDPDHEVVVRGRFWMDTPGVEILTPLRLRDGSAVLVMRGWMSAADGVSADLPAARVPADTAAATGLALPGESPAAVPPRRMRFSDGERLVLGTVDLRAAAAALPYPVAPFYLRVLPPEDAPRGPERAARANRAASVPVPLPAPELTNGPHLSYAIQWFGFAALALAGAFLLPRARGDGGTGPVSKPGGAEMEETRR
jgi:cytochrome oxidase assembly protein ShyY1